MVRSLLIGSVIVGLAGCSPPGEPDEDPCLAVAREYQAAMLDALVCDPAEPGSCAAGRPLIVSRQDLDGTVTLEGLCSTELCAAAVNPARTAKLDELLARFAARGCRLGPCVCPPPGSLPARCQSEGKCTGVHWPGWPD